MTTELPPAKIALGVVPLGHPQKVKSVTEEGDLYESNGIERLNIDVIVLYLLTFLTFYTWSSVFVVHYYGSYVVLESWTTRDFSRKMERVDVTTRRWFRSIH